MQLMRNHFTLALSIAIASVSLFSPLATHAQSPDGTRMSKDSLVEKWKTESAANASRPATRGLPPRGSGSTTSSSQANPALVMRSIALSANALDQNAAALRALIPRGIKKLSGKEAAQAFAAQNNADASGTSSHTGDDQQRPKAGAATQAPLVVVQVPLVTEQQVSFRLQFKLNSTEFADVAFGARQVATIAAAIKALPDTMCFLLTGHTCDLGKNAHNQGLSENRSLAVRTLLIGYGVAPARLLAAGMGESQFHVPNTSSSNRALNRRVEVGPLALPPRL